MRVLVVKLSSLGDLFHALPAVAQMKNALGAEVDWVTNQGYADLVRRFDPVRHVIPFPRKNFCAGLRPFLEHLRREEYDYVFDMQGLLKSALAARAARARKRIGPSFHREGSHFFYDAVTGPRNKNRHAVEENLDLLDFLGITRGPATFPVQFDLPEGLPADKAHVGLIPCSRWKTKNWPPEHFIELAKSLSDEAHLYVFGAPEDRAVCHRIVEESGDGNRVIDMCAKTTMTELGGWLSTMDLVITVDSGPMHIAAATGTPVLAIFGATDHRRTGPYGELHRVLHREDLACRPCLSRTCRLKERDIRCLSGLAPGTVITAARDMLAKTKSVL